MILSHTSISKFYESYASIYVLFTLNIHTFHYFSYRYFLIYIIQRLSLSCEETTFTFEPSNTLLISHTFILIPLFFNETLQVRSKIAPVNSFISLFIIIFFTEN